MSTRYVWDIYNVKSKGTEATESTSSTLSQTFSFDTSKEYVAVGMGGYTVTDEGFSPLNFAPVTLSQLSSGLSVITYPYLALVNFNGSDMPTLFTRLYKARTDSQYPQRTVWYRRTNYLIMTDSNYLPQITDSNFESYAYIFNVVTIKYESIEYSRGDTKTGNASSSSNSTYPNDGKSGNSWYVYSGSDNIDPQLVLYDKETVERGDTLKVMVTPSSTVEFGGTISYQYQVSGDGGTTWNNDGSPTTSTTKDILVTPNATQISARVQAQDEWGFVSETYVRGPNLSVTLVQGDYILFAGGYASASPYYSKVVDAYDSSLTHSTPSELNGYKVYLAGAHVGDYALFAGGEDSNPTNTVDSFDKSLTHNVLSPLNKETSRLAGAAIGSYALFAGGVYFWGTMSGSGPVNIVTAYNTSLTKTSAPNLSTGRAGLSSASNGNYAVFTGGATDYSVYNKIIYNATDSVDAYNKSLTHTIPDALSVARFSLASAVVGKYLLFAGGVGDNGVSSVVDAYDENLTRSIVTELSVARRDLAATSVGGYAIFGGGTGENGVVGTVDVYDSTLTRTINTDLSLARGELSAGTIGVYALFAGGTSGTVSDIVDIYRHI